jgi:hypothetical protein
MHSHKTIEELEEALRAGAKLVREAETKAKNIATRAEQVQAENDTLKKQIKELDVKNRKARIRRIRER